MPSIPRQHENLVDALGRYRLLKPTLVVFDLLVFLLAFIFSYLLRFDFQIPSNHSHNLIVQAPFIVLLQFVALTLTGGRDFIWRYTGLAHVKAFIYAALSSMALVASMRLLLVGSHQVWRVPLSINLFDGILAFGGAFALRVLRRTAYEHYKRRAQVKMQGPVAVARRPVLLIGAGQAGVLAANEIAGRGDLNLEIKGFVDDDRMKLGRRVVKGGRVLGTTDDLPALVQSLQIDHVVIAIAQASRQDIQRIVKKCEQIPVKVRIIPGLYEILDGRVEISRIRDVQIEDILGRDPVQLDVDSISKELAGKTVMVTGAGGSIGSELARQVACFSPARLLLVERAEFALFNIDRVLKQGEAGQTTIPLVADVGDYSRMRSIFESYKPDIVIHAAAHKHVPLMESNSIEAIKNNVFNTRLLCELSAEFGVEGFVLISTDKAVRPTSMMGASKRVAELVAQEVGRRSKTRFVAVRFGNVIGSNGSAIPIFQEQIRKGGPVTITDARMRRYFMTIPEAAQLVLQASTIGNGGEVFILHMGEPVNILELAEALISLSGLRPHQDIKIVETGLRPGEKLYEELTFETERTAATSHPKIFISRIDSLNSAAVLNACERLKHLVDLGDETGLRDFLNELLPEARIANNGVIQNREPSSEALAARLGSS